MQRFFGNLYGTPRDWVLSTLEKKEDVILELDIQGALSETNISGCHNNIHDSSCYEDLEKRLQNRDQDSAEVIKSRLKEAKKRYWMEKISIALLSITNLMKLYKI